MLSLLPNKKMTESVFSYIITATKFSSDESHIALSNMLYLCKICNLADIRLNQQIWL